MKAAAVNKPIIGISASLLMIETGCFKGRERVFVGQDYIQAIVQAGGIPVVLPVVSDEGAVERQMELIDGLLLSGGYDVHPLLYGEEPDALLQDLYPERDQYEIQLTQGAYQSGMPILGVCRGLQLMNVAFGGTLYQDVSRHSPFVLQHLQHAQVHVGAHTVELVEGTVLKNAMQVDLLLTNSFHHQSVKKVAPGFRVNALAKDGIVEGIEKVDHPFIVGVQWHPELMVEKQLEAGKLFKSFVEASKAARR
ncbi:Peptidase C26 family protein [Candidatus Protochlamydia naegleriophila]|uniref:gamma-glutamyl-gamma-aminobutyrate hydrolase n=1 Tax=Candidatus Protochlamydia naegleriophila TaxID=389348 RepID=A0A0U5ERD9_9BACT|nr:gamma-glutamyl-gamma-aminobutyrate hydrolase family protein [Candidatus Protochlamydia naegleriophila]CUI16755.1 Peptidase C26 family protein [Candidatus Protochlamydia naegleriophila]